MNKTYLSCTVELPPGFRTHEILAFHRRAPLVTAERVDENSLQKGLVWQGYAAYDLTSRPFVWAVAKRLGPRIGFRWLRRRLFGAAPRGDLG